MPFPMGLLPSPTRPRPQHARPPRRSYRIGKSELTQNDKDDAVWLGDHGVLLPRRRALPQDGRN